ncbi:MAG: hypothetical protein ABI890_01865 [Lapillicoccus sp.]
MVPRLVEGLTAHGVGNRHDLPLPFGFVVLGACVVLVLSFGALALWRAEPSAPERAGRTAPRWLVSLLDNALVRGLLAGAAGVLTLVTVLALLVGSDGTSNPAPYVVFVWLWIGLPFLSLLFGPVWRVLNPLRWVQRGLSRVAQVDPRVGVVPYPTWLGYRPAAVGLLAFTWLELVQPDRTSRPVLMGWVLVVVVVTLPVSLVLGDVWFHRGDPFGVASDLYGALAPLGRRADGTWTAKGPISGLAHVVPAPGLLATVSVMLGSTAYDGFQGNLAWTTYVQTSGAPVVLQTLGLVGFVLLVALTTTTACVVAARLAGQPVRGVATAFAPSLVPIAAGYVVAHYWSLLVFGGQVTWGLLSDPFGTGANYLGTAGLHPSTVLIAPTLTACIQVVAIIAGHVLGIVAAHDRALRLFDRRVAVVGQVPLLIVMVGYTVGGLVLLFSA